MAESRIGDPATLAVDVGPAIDAEARAGIEAHIDAMRAKGRAVFQAARGGADATAAGTFVVPTLIELERLGELEREVFGPVLHVVRYRRADLDAMIDQINATGYGLTLGVHSRIDETIARVVAAAHVGNVYVNRNMVGAVVGVQPFGGEGLSGTGPKAGGPLYLYRLLARRPADAMARALALAEGDSVRRGERARSRRGPAPLRALQAWAEGARRSFLERALRRLCRTVARRLGARPARPDRRAQPLFAACARGRPLPRRQRRRSAGPARRRPRRRQPRTLAERCRRAARAPAGGGAGRGRARDRLDRADGPLRRRPPSRQRKPSCSTSAAELAARPGPIVGVDGLRPGETAIALERLVIERALSVNTAAAGGNATLMTLQ